MDQSKIPFIDALRGYAIVLVIASHVFPMVHELPWALKRFTNLGFFGVQLFFLVSCMTLTRSWRQQESIARPSVRSFVVRRLFRVAPAYFLAAVLYFWLSPVDIPSAMRIATLLTFTNGWSPSQMPTVTGVWIGVPGGWSIEAEFAFYAFFPLLMLTLRGFWPAVGALLVSLPFAWVINALGRAAYEQTYGATATDQFLYYWLPNQLPVFLCGLVLFEMLVRLSPNGAWHVAGAWLARQAQPLLAGSLLAFVSLGILTLPRLPIPTRLFVPSHLLAALAFSGCALALALRPIPFLVNRAITLMGQASFSAYLLHFAILDAAERVLPSTLLNTTGVTAIAVSAVLFAVVLMLTGMLSQCTYHLIEAPSIQLGHRVNGLLSANITLTQIMNKLRIEINNK